MQKVASCYKKTMESKIEKAVEYYYSTFENRNTIEGKYFNLINTYEPTNSVNVEVLNGCLKKHW